jgi:hypothetical protein
MTPSPQAPDPLERHIHATLRALPARRAPGSLEPRVLAEIARCAALPWWRKSFAHWPLAARATFLVVSAGLVKLALMAGVWVMAGFDNAQFKDAFTQKFTWMENVAVVVRAIGDFFEVIGRAVPPLWFYGGIAVVFALYAMLFGLGAAAYKTLYAQR